MASTLRVGVASSLKETAVKSRELLCKRKFHSSSNSDIDNNLISGLMTIFSMTVTTLVVMRTLIMAAR
jgi:hypothetical protein